MVATGGASRHHRRISSTVAADSLHKIFWDTPIAEAAARHQQDERPRQKSRKNVYFNEEANQVKVIESPLPAEHDSKDSDREFVSPTWYSTQELGQFRKTCQQEAKQQISKSTCNDDDGNAVGSNYRKVVKSLYESCEQASIQSGYGEHFCVHRVAMSPAQQAALVAAPHLVGLERWMKKCRNKKAFKLEQMRNSIADIQQGKLPHMDKRIAPEEYIRYHCRMHTHACEILAHSMALSHHMAAA